MDFEEGLVCSIGMERGRPAIDQVVRIGSGAVEFFSGEADSEYRAEQQSDRGEFQHDAGVQGFSAVSID